MSFNVYNCQSVDISGGEFNIIQGNLNRYSNVVYATNGSHNVNVRGARGGASGGGNTGPGESTSQHREPQSRRAPQFFLPDPRALNPEAELAAEIERRAAAARNGLPTGPRTPYSDPLRRTSQYSDGMLSSNSEEADAAVNTSSPTQARQRPVSAESSSLDSPKKGSELWVLVAALGLSALLFFAWNSFTTGGSIDYLAPYALCSSEPYDIYTVDARNSQTQCILVDNGYIASTGSLAEVQLCWKKKIRGTSLSELQVRYIPPGSIVVPGLSDAHAYLLEHGASRESTKDVQETLRLFVTSFQGVKNLYAFRSIIESGARIALISDFPVESPNPLSGFCAAITRLSPNGKTPHGPGGWFPEERLTAQKTLRGKPDTRCSLI
ncbi:hypothetical protein B0H13DRAFT_2049732 [Mycena leptocephala]|nr:hypothetical protein B0H13DRAFT_2049732 [Mycena leptocephala]